MKIKINLNFYFHTSLWCLKGFYEGIYGLHKNFKLIFSPPPGLGREGLKGIRITVI